MISLLLGAVECRAQSATTETLSPPVLPANTPVIFRLTKSLYEKDAKPGQPVEFAVGFDVVVNGRVFIQRGAAVIGSVRQIDLTGKGPAKVLIDLGPAQTISGEMVRLAPTPTTKTNDQFDPTFASKFPPIIPVFLVIGLSEKKVLLDKDARYSWPLGCGLFVQTCGVWVVAHVGENVALDPSKLKAAQAQLRESFGDFFELEFQAQLLRQAGDLDAAIEKYQQALALMPDSPGSRESVPASFLAQPHVGLAELFREKRDFVHAIAEYRTAVQLDPKDEHTREGFVTFLVESDDPEAALAEIKEAMRIWPDNIYFHYLLGRLLVKKNDPDAAIVELQWALKKWKNHSSQTNCELGRAFEQKGNLRAALGQYRTACRAHLNDDECRAAYERLRLQLKK